MIPPPVDLEGLSVAWANVRNAYDIDDARGDVQTVLDALPALLAELRAAREALDGQKAITAVEIKVNALLERERDAAQAEATRLRAALTAMQNHWQTTYHDDNFQACVDYFYRAIDAALRALPAPRGEEGA